MFIRNIECSHSVSFIVHIAPYVNFSDIDIQKYIVTKTFSITYFDS